MIKAYPDRDNRFTVTCLQCNEVVRNEHECRALKCRCGSTEWKQVANSLDVYCQKCDKLREVID